MTENEMVGWHHQLNGHEFGQTPAVGDEQEGDKDSGKIIKNKGSKFKLTC